LAITWNVTGERRAVLRKSGLQRHVLGHKPVGNLRAVVDK
jgi:hypothetical protein